MSLPAPADDPRRLPEAGSYRVDISPAAIRERLAADEEVSLVKRFPPRSRTRHRYLAMLTDEGFRVIQNQGQSTLDGGPPVVRRFHLEAAIEPRSDGALVETRFERGPELRQLRYLVLWASAIAWLVLTGFTGAKLGMVVALAVMTIPAWIYDRRIARGSREDRIELLNLMERLLGPALIGQSPAEKTPYRDGHPALPGAEQAPASGERDPEPA
ncbi:MAG: hypothetical protein H6711_34930 [Myxococcales bacterium]|nr:hypothetical protein [Myxococcales bacterium]